MNARSAASAALLTVLSASFIAAQNAQSKQTAGRMHSETRISPRDWHTVDGDAGDMKFSELTQVTP